MGVLKGAQLREKIHVVAGAPRRFTRSSNGRCSSSSAQSAARSTVAVVMGWRMVVARASSTGIRVGQRDKSP
jgi:hypothetical protein